MESKILNFPDAMKLASILSKYVDMESIKDMTVMDFSIDLFSRMETDDIIGISKLFLKDNEIAESPPEEIMAHCTNGITQNGLVELLSAYKQIGFG